MQTCLLIAFILLGSILGTPNPAPNPLLVPTHLKNSSPNSTGKKADYRYEDEYLRVQIISLRQTGGTVTLTFKVENLTNKTIRCTVFRTGANGRNTFLEDSNGITWKLPKHGNPFRLGEPIRPNRPREVTLSFQLETGNTQVDSFSLVGHFGIYYEGEISFRHPWSKVVIDDIPVGYGVK